MKLKLALAALTLSTSAMSSNQLPKAYQIKSVEIIETTNYSLAKSTTPSNVINDALAEARKNEVKPENNPPQNTPPQNTNPNPNQNPRKEDPKPGFDVNQVGRIITVAKDFVALGEAVYDLVKKGKPTNTTSYAAISVVPKDPMTKEAVSPFDLEGFSLPEERSFSALVKNGNDDVVVRFDYQLVYSYGGSYDGKGKYLTSVMIVPKAVKTTFGWDFNATMKLDAIMNHGSKENPIAGALVTMKYQMNSWTSSFERNDTIHITGNGQVKSFGIR